MDASANLYAYVVNNPINSNDPLGLWRDPEHRRLIQLAMRSGTLFSQIDIERVKRASLNVDKLSNQFDGADHYMPGTEKEAEKLIRDAFEKAISYELAGQHETSMDELGKGLHTLQDKFAHYEQMAGWLLHIPFLGTGPDDHKKHPARFKYAYVASIQFIDEFLAQLAKRRAACED